MNKQLLDILACPAHQESELVFNEVSNKLECCECGQQYTVITGKDLWVPVFLEDDPKWEKGFRGLSSGLIKSVQGKPFKREIEKNKLILDVGCGDNPRGNINLDCYIPKVVPDNFVIASAEQLPFKKGSVDIVLSNYNLEHLVNPAIFIQNVYDITKEKIEIITDNDEWVGDIVFRLLGDGRIFHDEHYYKWSVEYLNNLVVRLGYKNHKTYLLNLSSNSIVKLFSYLGMLPRVGNIFYRDLKVEIWKA